MIGDMIQDMGPGEKKVFGVLAVLLLVGLGVWMFLYPDLGLLDNEAGVRKVRRWGQFLDMLWSRPVGIISMLGGLALIVPVVKVYRDN